MATAVQQPVKRPPSVKGPGSVVGCDTVVSFGSILEDDSDSVAVEQVGGGGGGIPEQLLESIGLAEFTNDEKFQLDSVLQRVNAAQTVDEKRKERLRQQLQSALTQASSVQENLGGGLLYTVCELCGGRLYLFTRRYVCQRCQNVACSNCVHLLKGGQSVQCRLCHLEFVTEAQSGEWFLAEVRRRTERAYFGPEILRASLRRERRRLVTEEKARRASAAASAAPVEAEPLVVVENPQLNGSDDVDPKITDALDSKPDVNNKKKKKKDRKEREKEKELKKQQKSAAKKDSKRQGKRQKRSDEAPQPLPPPDKPVERGNSTDRGSGGSRAQLAAIEAEPDADEEVEVQVDSKRDVEVDESIEVEQAPSFEASVDVTDEAGPLEEEQQQQPPDQPDVPEIEVEEEGPDSSVAMRTPSIIVTRETPAGEAVVEDGDEDGSAASSNLRVVDATSCESVLSNISETEESYKRGVRASGEVELSAMFSDGVLTVLVHRCRGLTRVDGRQPNPYVKTYLLPDKTKRSKRRTNARRGTCNPSFGAQPLVYADLTAEQLDMRILQISVWHSVSFGANIFLGEVLLPMEQCQQVFAGGKQWLTLGEHRSTAGGVSLPTLMYQGEVSLSIRFERENASSNNDDDNNDDDEGARGRLEIWVRSCSKLASASAGGTLDVSPYVKCYLLPSRNHASKRKSKVVKGNPNPEFNVMLTYNGVTRKELRERSIELTVWDHVLIGRNDFLGGVRLNIGDTTRHPWMDARGHEQTLWSGMLKNPNRWINGSLILRPNMDPLATHIAQ